MESFADEGIKFALLLAIIIPVIFYLFTLQKTLKTIAFESRMMAPGQVWLLLVPLFNIVWQFIIVSRLSDSIKNECMRLNLPLPESKPTYTLGITMTLLYLGSLIFNNMHFQNVAFFSLIAGLMALASLVCWIVYWVKINSYKNLFIANQHNFLLDAEKEALHITN